MRKDCNFYTNYLLVQLDNDFTFYKNFVKIAKSKDNEACKKEKLINLINEIRDKVDMLLNCTMTPRLNNNKYINVLDISCMINAINEEIDYNYIINCFLEDMQNFE